MTKGNKINPFEKRSPKGPKTPKEDNDVDTTPKAVKGKRKGGK